VVYTVGSLDKPALTCQARPQEGECFGEFPPRREVTKFTHLPVIIPSSTPGYNAVYTEHYLRHTSTDASPAGMSWTEPIIATAESAEVRGFLKLLVVYLADSCGPKTGFGARTALFGLQRPPLLEESPTALRVTPSTTGDDLLPTVIPFLVTNARSQMQLSVDPAVSPAMRKVLDSFRSRCGKGQFIEEGQAEFEKRCETTPFINVLTPGERPFEPILVAHWVSRLFPMGHIKSVNSQDADFLGFFMVSQKWLRVQKEHRSAL